MSGISSIGETSPASWALRLELRKGLISFFGTMKLYHFLVIPPDIQISNLERLDRVLADMTSDVWDQTPFYTETFMLSKIRLPNSNKGKYNMSMRRREVYYTNIPMTAPLS